MLNYFSISSARKKIILLVAILFSYIQTSNAQAFITRWKTDNPGTASNQIQIPGTGNYQIHWVDINNTSNSGTTAGSGTTLLTLPSIGTYEISITGGLTAIKFDGGGDRDKILSVEQWGNIAWSTMESAFKSCANLVINATDAPDLSQVTDMSNMFYQASSINQNINHWNVSHVTDMSQMFMEATTFNQPLNNWNVSNVSNMYWMFYQAEDFNQPLDNWNVGNVTDMTGTFYFAESFNQNINSWNVANVTDMDHMFSGAKAFNQPLNNWDVSNVTNMSSMFYNCQIFNQPLNNWNVSNVESIADMFSTAMYFNQPLDNWNVSSVTNMRGVFYLATYFNQNISNWDVSNVTNMEYLFAQTQTFNQPIGNWNVGNVTSMLSTFNNAWAFNYDISNWNVSNVTNMASMFGNGYQFNQPLSNWDMTNVTTMQEMFYQAHNFNQNIKNWNVSNVALMGSMFYGAGSFNQDLSKWDITNVTDLTSMLNKTALSNANYDALLKGWSTQNVITGLDLGAVDLKYCTATDARNVLINDKGWTIAGDALECITATSTVNSQSATNQINCYPNPLNRSLNQSLTIKGVAGNLVNVTVSDISGKIIYSGTLTSSNGEFTLSYDKLSSLISGTYIVNASSEIVTFNQLLVIQ